MQMNNPDDVKKLGRILAVWAHPDDETFCAGGLIATAVQNGQQTTCITFTKGEAGVQDAKRWPPEKLGEIRAVELEKALAILGCKQHETLDFADGGLNQVSEEQGVGLVKDFIAKYAPDTIITFGPEGLTGHTDHQTVSGWVSAAVKGFDDAPVVYHVVELRSRYNKYMKALDEKINIFFNIDEPPLRDESECDICFKLPEDICRKKIAALVAMPSQTEKMMSELGDTAGEVFSIETFVRA